VTGRGTSGGEIVWTPPADVRSTSRIGAFLDWLVEARGLAFEATTTCGAGRSTTSTRSGSRAPSGPACGGTRLRPSPWLAARCGGAVVPRDHVNYSGTRSRRPRCAPTPSRSSLTARPARAVELTWSQLAEDVARCRAGLVRLGVRPGDRVCRLPPEHPETTVAFLAAASLGAIWSSCGARVRHPVGRRPLRADRADGAVRGRRLPVRAEADRQAGRRRGHRGRAAGAAPHVHVPYGGAGPTTGRNSSAESGPLEFDPCPFTTALRVVQLGTTAAQGDRARPRGITVEHLKTRHFTTTSAPATASSGSRPPAG